MRNLRLIIIAGVIVTGLVLVVTRNGGQTNGNTNGNENQNANATLTENANANTNATDAVAASGQLTNRTTNTISNANANAKRSTETLAPSFSIEERPTPVTVVRPRHGSKLTVLPSDLSVTFNQAVASHAALSLQREGVEYGAADVVTADGGTTIRRGLSANAPDGIYTINYYACLADGTCVSGHAQFALQ